MISAERAARNQSPKLTNLKYYITEITKIRRRWSTATKITNTSCPLQNQGWSCVPITFLRAKIELDTKQLFPCLSRAALIVRTSQSDAQHVGKVLQKSTPLAEILVGFSKWLAQRSLTSLRPSWHLARAKTTNANTNMKCAYTPQVIFTPWEPATTVMKSNPN